MQFFAFDSLAQADKLETIGFSHEQAKILIEVITMAFITSYQNLATKDDLLITKNDLHHEIDALRSETHNALAELRAEFKKDIAELRAEFKKDIAELRDETKQEIAELRLEIQKLRADFEKNNSALIIKLSAVTVTANGLFLSLFKVFA